MLYKNSYFELHAGFPDDSVSALAAERFVQLSAGGRSWTRSAVTSVHMKNPGCIDPHNVPGTLGSLVSCTILGSEQASWEAVIEQVVLPTSAAALENLSRLGARDARLEIECPFGWLSTQEEVARPTRGRSIFEPVRIPASLLQRLTGAMPDVPQWEIHFVAEPRSGYTPNALSIETLPTLIEQCDVDVEQTIQYRSQAMRQSAATTSRYISTSYYPTPADVVAEANRIFDTTALSEELWSRGYRLTLILEHIIGCFQPTSTWTISDLSRSLDEVKSAH